MNKIILIQGISQRGSNHTAVEALRRAEVVRERTGYERNRVFAAEEVISLLGRRFGSDPSEALEGARAQMRLR